MGAGHLRASRRMANMGGQGPPHTGTGSARMSPSPQSWASARSPLTYTSGATGNCLAHHVQVAMWEREHRPGRKDRLGLSWSHIHPEKPIVIDVRSLPMCQSGPRASQGGFEVTMQAASGVRDEHHRRAGGPPCEVRPFRLRDFTAGSWRVCGQRGLTRVRGRRGRGCYRRPHAGNPLAISKR